MAHLDLRRVREEVCLVVLHLDVFDAAVPTLASIQVEKRQCCLGKADVLACRRVVAMDLQRYVGAWLDVHHCEVAVHAVLRRPCRLVGGREFQAFLLAVGELAAADDVEVHLHVVSGSEFTHSEEEGLELPATYEPAWPSENGMHGNFAVVNVKPGTNVTLQVHGYDPATSENIRLPKAALTFFDLDAGKGGNRSIEYIKMEHYKAYFLTNATEIQVSHEEGSTTFRASKEGSGDDNPDDPLALTVLQKNRAVSFEFENEEGAIFQLGASLGETARVFSFVMRPALRCASTVLEDGTVLPANATDAPVTIVRGAGERARPLLLLFLVLALTSLPWHFKN
mmetsp:Transcript_45865/g.105919  ORF Transcript_45865/g.105919 Transcript_45865/m.105919 type:complete len:339 (-) Transcript_45865:177-1193(-)